MCDALAVAARVPIFDEVTGTTFSANLEIRWRGTGTIEQAQGGSFTRAAVASGQVRIRNTNLTPTPSNTAEIQEVQSPAGPVPTTCG